MLPPPDAATVARALAALPAFAAIGPSDLEPLPQKGLAHAHWRLRDRGLLVRIPRMPPKDRSADAALAYQAESFRRAAPSARTPTLHAVLPPSAALPAGALVVDDIVGHAPRLPTELSLIAEALASIHALPVPAPEDRAPLADTADAFAATLAVVERNARFLETVNAHPDARRQIGEEIAWARRFLDQEARSLGVPPHTFVVSDAHPGNFIVTGTGLAMFVDLEKAAYGSPAIDIAHATLRPATRWDPDCECVLAREDVERFVRTYFLAVGPMLEGAIRPWLLPMRRLTWLRTTTVFARFRAENAAAVLAPDVAAHVDAVIDDALDPATIARVRAEWLGPDALQF